MKATMRPEELLTALACVADREGMPTADVAARVVLRIRTLPARAERPLIFLALGAAAAAVLVLAFALPAWQSWTDPLSQVILLASGGAP